MADEVGEAVFPEPEEASTGRYRSLVRTIGDGCCRLTAAGEFAAVSDSLAGLAGRPREDLVGRHASAIFRDAEGLEPSIRDALAGGTATVDLSVRTADGAAVPCELALVAAANDGSHEGVVGVLRERDGRGEHRSPPDSDAGRDQEPPEDRGSEGTRSAPERDDGEPRSAPGRGDGESRNAPGRGGVEALADALDAAGIGVFVLDEDFEVAWLNGTVARFFGLDREAVVGREKAEVVDREVRDAVANEDSFVERLLATYREGAPAEEFECRVLPGEDREERRLVHRSLPIERGRFAGGRIELYEDVTDRRRTERELDRTERSFRSLVEATEEYAIFMLDPDGRVVTWNPGAERIKGYEREEILGEHFSAFYPEEAVREGVPERNLRLAAEEGSIEDEGWRVRKDGSRFWARVTITAVHDEEGNLEGFAKVTRDMTDRREYERRLEEQRDALKRELDEVFERIDDAFYALDEEFRFTYVNERARELLDRDEAALLGERIWDVFPEVADAEALDAFRDALETQESTSFETHVEPLDLWVEANVYPSETGLSVYFRDVTERREARRRLRRHNRTLRRLYEISSDRERPLDERIEQVLALGCEYLDLGTGFLAEVDQDGDRFEVLHASGDDDRYYPGATAPLSETYCRRTIDEDGVLAIADAPEEGFGDDPAYREWDLDCYVGGSVRIDGERYGTLCFVDRASRSAFDEAERTFVELATQWMSYELERERRRRRLERYREYTDDVLGAIDDLFYTIDEEARLRRWNDAVGEVSGYAEAELDGKHVLEFFEGEDRERVAERISAAFETGSATVEADFVTKDGERIPYEFTASTAEDPDGNPVLTGIGRDVSERKRRERELDRRRRQQQAVADLGQFALEADDLDELMAEACRRVSETLDADYCEVLELDPDREELVLRQGAGREDDAVGTATVDADGSTQVGYALRSEEPVVVEDLEADARFSGADLSVDGDVGSGASTVVGSVEEPWGVLGVHDAERREFDDEDVSFLQSVANVLATAIERADRERALERQRERLAALNSLNEVVREATGAAIEQSTRGEIEEIVCERLAASDSYEFAWIGDVDAATDRVVPRASAGTDGYLEEIDVTVDPEDDRSRGPTGRAVRTGELQAVQNVRDDPEYGPWRETALEYGFRSTAAVPIVHEGTVFGVLNVYADRPYAFAGEEREMISHLGETVGHALAAVERKRALLSDDVVEVQYRIPDVLGAYDVPAPDGRIEFDRVVPVGDEDYVVYGTVTEGARETLTSLVEPLEHWEAVSIDDGDDEARFELRMSGPPMVATVAARGGAVESARLEGADFYATIHLPQGVDVREVLDVVEEEYATVEPLARRQIERAGEGTRRATAALLGELTDRQRAALETAYFGGFFEWPRESAGEEIADQLGISPATFSQHLRAAQRKLLAEVFEELPASG